jgi:hypothetical protein
MSDDETNKTARRADGTFVRGASGNPKGRPKKDRRIPSPEIMRDMQYDVAEFGMTLTINGKRHKVNLLQANLMTLAIAGAAGDKAAARSYLKHVQMCTEQELREMARLIKRLDGLTPAYELERDPVRRARLEEAWRRALAEATGERERTTGGLGKNKPPRWPDR